jgi:gliding motility-associated lipoprotein GldH
MRSFAFAFLVALLVIGCDNRRIFQKNEDLEGHLWLIGNRPSFEFIIPDSSQQYNLYCNLRNEVSYPKANLYFTYYITDSTGRELKKKLVSRFLFDEKTGKPFGSSALGDIYDHQILIEKNYIFKHTGKFRVIFEQFMRNDTLPGILAVGLRVEKTEISKP